MPRRIDKKCSTCDHWMRVSMPADVGMCIPTTRICTGDDFCDRYEPDPQIVRKKPRRKRGVSDGETQ